MCTNKCFYVSDKPTEHTLAADSTSTSPTWTATAKNACASIIPMCTQMHRGLHPIYIYLADYHLPIDTHATLQSNLSVQH